jgi:hypothetical protein
MHLIATASTYSVISPECENNQAEELRFSGKEKQREEKTRQAIAAVP